jgi:tRNA/rRNA methyltransferase
MAGTDKSKTSASGAGPAIVLVKPQLGENIGAAARAMLNFGLSEMRLVAPRDGWPSEPARANASGADAVIDGAALFDATEAAIADCHRVYATTARPRYMVKPVLTPREAAARMRAEIAAGERVGILFGNERAGLDNDDVARADTVITAPLNPGFSSLNLAQAVLLVASEWWQAVPPPEPPAADAVPPASKERLFTLFRHLEQELEAAGFFVVPEKQPSMIRTIRNLIARAEPTDQEVGVLHGIVTALSGRRLGGAQRGRRDVAVKPPPPE